MPRARPVAVSLPEPAADVPVAGEVVAGAGTVVTGVSTAVVGTGVRFGCGTDVRSTRCSGRRAATGGAGRDPCGDCACGRAFAGAFTGAVAVGRAALTADTAVSPNAEGMAGGAADAASVRSRASSESIWARESSFVREQAATTATIASRDRVPESERAMTGPESGWNLRTSHRLPCPLINIWYPMSPCTLPVARPATANILQSS